MLRKTPPNPSSFPALQFTYAPSPDELDKNLLVLFHGLGITPQSLPWPTPSPTLPDVRIFFSGTRFTLPPEGDFPQNFIGFGKSLRLPETALLAIKGPCPIPYFDEETGWAPAYDEAGEGGTFMPALNAAPPPAAIPLSAPRHIAGFYQTRTLLTEFFRTVLLAAPGGASTSGWPAGRITLLGFSQGGRCAVDLALFSGLGVGGAVSIGGWIETEMYGAAVAAPGADGVRVLVTQGTSDEVVPVREVASKKAFLERMAGPGNASVVMVEGKGHTMPTSEVELRAIAQFLASAAFRCAVRESDLDVIEISVGTKVERAEP
ncbi:hypothetical protein BDK51DRAFT_51661 [Blyttiomyces helicus]|uniref:Phospholipase/carboxylesterase/thioesterase domain-containing protein n=1 Tax=Blyttiomyces helicus TaxID=388810 RepID=A0A4P9W6D1_9FUNG|nr:hypothetical protein BDK51DRAFT_51661 [Blyttiomyces helicus]|eukprot:RKO88011.1 hypothetical protein BDK51DRAFT_51661 [Blyttiomyces helicus]